MAARLAARKSAGGADWLFVGRLVPSKRQHELVKALWAYRRLYDPDARLHLVGPAPSGRYLRALRAFLEDLGPQTAVRVTGEVSDAALAAYFAAADVYVSLSVHEGFGVPLIEAMRGGPAGGGPSDRGGAGHRRPGRAGARARRPATVAAAVHRVLTDAELAGRLARRRYGARSPRPSTRALRPTGRRGHRHRGRTAAPPSPSPSSRTAT